MKFSELPEAQSKALTDFYGRIVDALAQEQRAYSLAGFRLLLLGNSAGVALLAGKFAGLYSTNASQTDLVTPLIFFLVGVFAGGFAYWPVIAVASGTARHIGDSVEKFIRDEIELEDMRSWGHNKLSTFLLMLFVWSSLICLIIGTIMVVRVLR